MKTCNSSPSACVRRVLAIGIASLITVPTGFAAEAIFSSGGFTNDATTGIGTSKTYVAAANIIGGDVTVNGVTLLGSGSGLSGTGWNLANVGAQFGSGGNHTTTFGGQAIIGLFDAFQYNGNPGYLTLSGLTAGKTYVATLYNQAWGLGDNRTMTMTSTEGADGYTYNEDALEASALRYTFVATGSTSVLNFLPQIPGNTFHFYGLTNEEVFTNTWTPASGNSWNTAANWSSGVIPDGVGSNAEFSAQLAPTTVTLAAPTTVGHVRFLGSERITVDNGNILTLQTDAGGTSVLSDDGGEHTINAPIVLNSDVVKFGYGTLTLGGAVSGAQAVTVGAGTLKFGATNTYTGGTTVTSFASLDLNSTSQNLGTLNGGGSILNDGSGTSTISVTSGRFTGTIINSNSGPGLVGLTKTGAGTLSLAGTNTYTGATIIDGGTLRLQAGPSTLLTDNFSATGNPNTGDINFNLANRQTGSAATQTWNPVGNTQVGNPTPVQQPLGTNGDYLLLAFGASASLANLPLTTSNVPGPLKINFDMFKGHTGAGDDTGWASFTLRGAANQGFPIAGSGEFGFLYRRNTGVQLFNNGGLLQDFASTSGGDNFSFYLADAAGSGSPFAGNGTRLVVIQGSNLLGSYLLDTGMGTRYITFGSDGAKIGGVDNLAVNPYEQNLLSPDTAVSLPNSGSTFALDAVNQRILSLNGVSGTSVTLSPFSKLTIGGPNTSSYAGTISGIFASLTKTGGGVLYLSGANTYSGGTNIENGSVFAHHASALGTGLAVNIGNNSNYLPWWNTGSANIPHNFTLNGLGGNPGDGNKGAIYADGGAGGFHEYSINGTITLAASSNVGTHDTNNLRINGKISGPGGLSKGTGRADENGTLILGNTANDYAGDTTFTRGTVKLGASQVIPDGAGKGNVTVGAGTTLDLGGFSETINNLSGAGTITSTASVGTPIYFDNDSGTGISASKTYTHALDFAEGTDVTINGVVFSGAGLSGGNYTLSGASPSAGNGATAATGDISRLLTNFYYGGNPATLTLTGLTAGVTYETRLYARQWGGNRTQLFTLAAGSGSATSVYDEDATGSASILPFRFTADGTGQVSITTNQLGDGSYHWFGASNEVTESPKLTVGDALNTLFSGSITGPLALTKVGSGSLELSGTSSFTGATTINNGKLIVSGSLTGTSGVSVASGATLAGAGTINANVSIASGGEIAPGNSIGTLLANNLSLADTSLLTFELDETYGDQIVLSGAATLTGLVNLALSFTADPIELTTFTLIDGSSPLGGISGGARLSYSGNTLEEGERFTATSGMVTQDFIVSYTADGGNDITLFAIPEPGSAALLVLSASALLIRRRRRA